MNQYVETVRILEDRDPELCRAIARSDWRFRRAADRRADARAEALGRRSSDRESQESVLERLRSEGYLLS